MIRPSPEQLYTQVPSLYSTGWGFVNNFTRDELRYYRTWSGVKTPGFRRMRTKDLPFNNHTVHIVKFSQNTFTRRRKKVNGAPTETDVWTDGISQITRPSGSPSLYDSVPDWSAYNKALDRVMDEVLDRKSNFAQFVAERHQLVKMVNDTVSRMTKAVRAVRKGNFAGVRSALGYAGGPKRTSGSVGNDWLAFQYGWKPLLSDVKGAAEHLAQNHLGRPLVLRVTKSAKGTTPADSVYSDPVGKKPGTSIWTRGVTESRFKVFVEYDVTNDFIRQGSQLGIADPLTLAWELTPWSFVVDWFLPVGKFIEQLNFDSGLTFRKGGYMSFNKTSNSVRLINGQIRELAEAFYDCTYTTGSSVASSDVTYMFRVKWNSFPSPRFPSFKDPFSPVHTANALALLRGAFGR